MSEKTERSYRIVLLAEDDLETRVNLSLALQKEGFSVIECKDGMDLLKRVSPLLKGDDDPEYDLIISDIRMPRITGIEVVEGLSNIKNSPPVVVISSSGDSQTRERAHRSGASAVLVKPLDIKKFIKVVRDTLPVSGSDKGLKGKSFGNEISGQ